ncbi:hypothetical protein HMPREF1870_00001 [Bacteroidales bacterium KA00344]|nr:hypothetical protein HMPREF1870_00001 [Bacteroidales bacterium KA00344]
MKTINNPKRKVSVTNQRSYFDWTDGMQVGRKGNGEIAMTESELVKFFGVTWRKLNHRLKTIIKSSSLHPDERVAGEEPVFISGQLKGCAPLYPLPVIIALSFLLDSIEAYLFRNYICHKVQRPMATITSIFLIGNTDNW